IVSKARDDLPDPERPVMQMRRFRGSRTVMSFRLCSRAPWTTSSSAAIRGPLYPANMCSGRGSGATPTVRVAGLGEACLDRVVEDVVARGGEVLVVPDHARPEAFAEQVAASPVAEVEPLRVRPLRYWTPAESCGCVVWTT